MIHVDGQLLPRDEARVSVFDAGFQSGDAIWEGLRVYNGQPFRFEQHLDRLEQSARPCAWHCQAPEPTSKPLFVTLSTRTV